MLTGQFYKRTKKTLPPNRIIVMSEESDDDMVGSSDSKMDISIETNLKVIVHVLKVLKNHL